MQPDMIVFVRRVKECAQKEQWNKYEINMLEEIEEILGYDISEEQKRLELKRVEKILLSHQNQGQQENGNIRAYREKQSFLQNLQKLLSDCKSRCDSVLERQIAAMEPEYEVIQEELQEACNAQVNWKMMKSSQNFRRLILSKTENFNNRLRTATVPFVQELTGEYDRCFGAVKGQMVNTRIEEFSVTEKTWYEKAGNNLDLLHSQIQAEADSVRLEEAPFENFATQCGTALERTVKKQERFTMILYLIPLALYFIKYILDTYVIQKEGIKERMANMLLERMVQNGEDTTEGILGAMKTVVPLLEDKGAAGLGLNLVLAALLFGWLYFLYVVIVRRVRRGALIRSLGGCAQQQMQEFAEKKPWKTATADSLMGLSQRIQDLYWRHYEFVNQKLVLEPLEESESFGTSMLLREYESLGG